MTQYNELKKLISGLTTKVNVLEKENKSLKAQINKKQNKFSDSQDAGDHAENWEKVKKTGIMNGKNPNQPITRAQYATTLVRTGVVK